MHEGSEVFRNLPFPFDDGVFPANLGALVQRTVLDGHEPAREVVHAEDGSWLVADGINDPNPPGACVVTHMAHVVEQNSSVAGLADLPAGHMATRTRPGDPWLVTALRWEDD